MIKPIYIIVTITEDKSQLSMECFTSINNKAEQFATFQNSTLI